MIFIPGFAIALLTFPGVIVHELAHLLFCRLLNVPVFSVCYFRLGTPSGFVIYEPPDSPWKNLLIGIGPILVNSVLGMAIAFPSVLGAGWFNAGNGLDFLFLWLGFSIAMHSFPSTGDAATIWKSVMAPKSPLTVKLVGVPLVGLIWLGAIGSVFWLDAVYSVCVLSFGPILVVNSLAALT